MIMTKYTLRQLREDLSGKVTQMQVAVRAGVSLNAVVNAENPEKKLQYGTLTKILKGINSIREEQGKPAIQVHEMDWNIR